MRILVETDAGVVIELKEIETVSESDILIAQCSVILKDSDRIKLENDLQARTGKRFVLLPPWITKIFGV